MAFRPIAPLQVFLDNQGEPLAGGSLSFTEVGTTTEKDVFADADLTTNLGDTVTLDIGGRAPDNVWGSGSYRIRLYNALGALVDEADEITEQGVAGVTFPSQAGNAGKFLTTDGTTLTFAPIREVPDPTGSTGRYLTNDGINTLWAALPAAADPDVVVGANSFRAGTSASTTKKLIQTGSSSAPSSGSKSTSVSVVFATAFTALEHVGVTVTTDAATAGALVRVAVTTQSATGFTVKFSTTTGGTSADNFTPSDINNAVTFTYMAIGTLVVP